MTATCELPRPQRWGTVRSMVHVRATLPWGRLRCRVVARRSILAVALLWLLSQVGCVTVPPSQRGYLAKPEMSPGTGALEEGFHSHVEAAREAGFGGHGTQGGGCGCG